VRAPTLVLHGDLDHFVSVSHARYYVAAIPGARLELIKGAAHLLLQTFRTETSTLIGTFLDPQR
jgi:pimeloyl-ACP methyl ester carboxylesterase